MSQWHTAEPHPHQGGWRATSERAESCTQSYTVKVWVQAGCRSYILSFGHWKEDVRIDVVHVKQAKEYYNRVLVTCLRKLWVEHVDGGTCYGNLGVVHCLLAALNEAKGCPDGTEVIRVRNLRIHIIHSTSIFKTWALFVRSYLGDLKQAKEVMTSFFRKGSCDVPTCLIKRLALISKC